MGNADQSTGEQNASLPAKIWNQTQLLVRRYFWVLLGAAGAVSFALGVWGFREAQEAINWQDASYQTIQLIVLNSGYLEGASVPWQLNIARFSLPVVTGVLGFAVLLSIFTDQKTVVWLWLFRPQVVIAGLGEPGFLLAKSRRELERVVVIERDPRNTRIAECRKLGVSVLIGDATDPEMLRRARLQSAEFLISVCSDDGTNGAVAMQAREVTTGRKGGGLTCIVHVSEPQLSMLITEYAFGNRAENTFRLESFNIDQSGARAMLERFPPFAEADKPHLVIVGLGRLGRWLLVQAAQRWELERTDPSMKLRVTVIDKMATDRIGYVKKRHPHLNQVWEPRPIDLPIESGELESSALFASDDEFSDVTSVYVCLRNESAGLTAALKLHHHLSHSVPIVVRTKGAGLAALLEDLHAKDKVPGAISGFRLLEQTCDSEVIDQGLHESIARAKHDDYIKREEKRGQTSKTNPAMSPWDELPVNLKESNREQAANDRVMLRSIDYEIEPRDDRESVLFKFTPAQVEDLAEKEHVRWVQEKEDAGYKLADVKNDRKKTNPYLKPWSKFTDEEQEDEREPIRRMPRILAAAGYQIVKRKAHQHPGAAG